MDRQRNLHLLQARRRPTRHRLVFAILLISCLASPSRAFSTGPPRSRRECLLLVTPLLIPCILGSSPSPAVAADLFLRELSSSEGYTFQPPPGFETPSQKPLKTHLDEITFKKADVQFGITVDPLRINSLREFGTPEEVAAKVVTAEVNRDGVFEVQLMEDPLASVAIGSDTTFYQLNYRSSGKRGVKRFVTKFYVDQQKLYALTAQCKEENYESVKQDLLQAVDSFQLLPKQ